MIKDIISRLTMVKTGESLYDEISHTKIYYWQDIYFDQYLSKNRWGWRVLIRTQKNK
jgi:hypothetical protein